MPLDDHVSTSPMVSQSAAAALPQKGKVSSSKKAGGTKDEILINPDIKEIMQEAAEKHHVLAFGRMNPITSGHEAVVKKIDDVAKEHKAGHTLVVSHSQDAKKNPLTSAQKVEHAKHAFSGTNVVAASKAAPTILHHAVALHKQGIKHLHIVAGSDRADEMHTLLHKYNGQNSGHGHYNFKSITVHSSGARDPDAEGTSGMSASKMREHAASGNKKAFHTGAPSTMSTPHKDAMYNDVRKGMGLHESNHILQRHATIIVSRRLHSKLIKRHSGRQGVKSIAVFTGGDKNVIDTQIKNSKDPQINKIKDLVKNNLTGLKKPTNNIKSQINNSVELDQNKFNSMYERFFVRAVILDEDAADHLRQASILQRTGKFQTASMHRKIAAALQRGDATAAKALTADLKNINE